MGTGPQRPRQPKGSIGDCGATWMALCSARAATVTFVTQAHVQEMPSPLFFLFLPSPPPKLAPKHYRPPLNRRISFHTTLSYRPVLLIRTV